jgi:integrase
MRERTERAHGPYEHRKRWRVVLVAADGTRRRRSFASREKALAYLALWQDETDGRTLSAAVDQYVQHLRDTGKRATTIETVAYRLRGLLRTHEHDRLLRQLTAPVARALFDRRAQETSGETQRGELATVGGFASWCVEHGWLRADPFADLEPKAPRAAGKPRLRIDEARKLLDVALDAGEPGVAVAMALLMGLRASEITARVVRDVDDGARVLWIERAKTRAGDRSLEIPEVLRPLLAAMCAGRPGGELLFRGVDRHWLGYHARRLCRLAEVPVVPPHGLRGTWGSIAAEAQPVDHVARALGHAGSAITRRHYLAPGSEQIGRQRAALRVLGGGQ